MFGLHNKIYMLLPLLAVCGAAVAQPNLVNLTSEQPKSAAIILFDDEVLLESRVPGHLGTLWRHIDWLNAPDNGAMLKPPNDAYLDEQADVVEMLLHDAITACESGEINLLPFDQILSVAIDPADYVWNGLQPCAIGHSVWADMIVFDNTMFIDRPAPEILRDFFDTENFPGKRVARKTPRALAEWSQMLAGVPQRDIYSALGEESGWHELEQVLLSLDDEIVWVDSDIQALELVDSGDAAFAIVSSPELVRHIIQREVLELPYSHYSVIWNGAITHMSMLALPKKASEYTSTHLADYALRAETSSAKALKFLRYLLDPFENLQLSTANGYAPANMVHTGFIEAKYRQALPLDIQLGSLVWSNDKWWR